MRRSQDWGHEAVRRVSIFLCFSFFFLHELGVRRYSDTLPRSDDVDVSYRGEAVVMSCAWRSKRRASCEGANKEEGVY